MAAIQMPIVLDLQADDIKFGKPKDPCWCPMSRAFSRQFPGSDPYINADGVAYNWEGQKHDYVVTQEAINWMDRFDAGEVMTPGKVTLVE